MRFSLFLFLFFTLFSCAQKKKVSITISGERQYCGGAKPTAEITKALQTPAPYANKKIALLSSDGKADTVYTDSTGNLTLKLRTGRYRLMELWRYNKSAPGGKQLTDFDKECLKKEWNKVNKIISVTKSGFTVTDSLGIVLYCDWRLPCLSPDANTPVPD